MAHNMKNIRRPRNKKTLDRVRVLKFFRMENSKDIGQKESSADAKPTKSNDIVLDPNSDFYNTGRVGRRNALPDILCHQHCTTSTSDLPARFNALSTKDDTEPNTSQASTSSAGTDQNKTPSSNG